MYYCYYFRRLHVRLCLATRMCLRCWVSSQKSTSARFFPSASSSVETLKYFTKPKHVSNLLFKDAWIALSFLMTSCVKSAFFEFTDVGELESLLSKQAPLEAYIEWLDSVVDRCVMKVKSFVKVLFIVYFRKSKRTKNNVFWTVNTNPRHTILHGIDKLI